MQRECEAATVRLVREDQSDAVKVSGDPDLLKQAILNLVVNAQDSVAAKPNGARLIRMATGKDTNQVFIRVADTGDGVSAEDAQGLFKLFYSGKRGGTGLGLPIAQRIVESHGGRISWRNLPDGGAEFIVWLNT